MFRRLSSRSRIIWLLVVLAGTACAGGAPAATPEPFSGDTSEVLRMVVRNQQLADARVYLWIDGQRQRLGSVRANGSSEFFQPMDGIRNVQLGFDLTLGPQCVSQGMSLGPGDNVEATIPGQLVAFAGTCR